MERLAGFGGKTRGRDQRAQRVAQDRGGGTDQHRLAVEVQRQAEVRRDTLETRISVKINLDGTGQSRFQTGVPFYQPWEITEALQELSRFFPKSGLYLSVVPTYIGGFMALAIAGRLRDLRR